MERLPWHLIDLIVVHIYLQDAHTCLTVNKAWHSIFIPFVYEIIDYSTQYKSRRLARYMTLYPGCREAGIYTKSLDLYDNERDFKKYDETIEEAYITILKNCPNIEYLNIFNTNKVIKTILNPRVPQLQHLKYLEFSCNFDVTNSRHSIKKCYALFHSSLRLIRLDGFPKEDLDPVTLLPYLASFPLLTLLDLSSHYMGINHTILDEILIHCPCLTYIRARGSLNVGDDVQISSHKYPHIEELDLSHNRSTLNDIEYIKKRFPCLRKLSFQSVNSRFNNKMIKSLVSMDYLVDISFAFSRYWNPALLPSRYKQKQVYSEVSFIVNSHDPSYYVRFQKGLHAGIKSMHYIIPYSVKTFNKCLMDFGYLLSGVEVVSESYIHNPPVLNLGDMIRRCPSLSSIKLYECDSIIVRGEIIPNTNLKTLELYKCELTSSLFRIVETAYPKLQKLKLMPPYFEGGNMEQVLLPDITSLLLMVNVRVDNVNYIVVREVDGVPAQSWHINFPNIKMVISKGSGILSAIRHLSDKPIYILRSSTLEEVCIEDQSLLNRPTIAETRNDCYNINLLLEYKLP
ncbi:hypothetical protein BDB01DRAFT_424299 [Pilobolus umbonatus]|nr:hypothetical protein BDB01DRAFT_424299 [Pilobolus umbonatus]